MKVFFVTGAVIFGLSVFNLLTDWFTLPHLIVITFIVAGLILSTRSQQ
jgi:uncharacterized membrane protein SirB2